MTRTLAGLLFFILCADCLAQTPASPETRFRQERLLIGMWSDPPAEELTDERYAEIAGAGINCTIGYRKEPPDVIQKRLDLCQRHGLSALVPVSGLEADPAAWPTGPALLGYLLVDEPHPRRFADLGRTVAAVRAARPGKLAYINLFPLHALPRLLGVPSVVKNYDEHMERFVEATDVDVLSFDHYPVMRPDTDGRDQYCRNLEIIRRVALERSIPFWNFFNTMPFQDHSDPTEAQLRWQIYAALTYGAKGVMYFCYWTPKGGEFPKGGAIITAEGRRTRHYEQATRINAELANLGPTLMQLTSVRVVRVQAPFAPSALLGGYPLKDISKGDYLVGEFVHWDGRRAVMITNYYHAFTQWPTVVFNADPAEVLEVDPKSGREAPVVDDSPAMEGLQVSLDAGCGRLFLLPPKAP